MLKKLTKPFSNTYNSSKYLYYTSRKDYYLSLIYEKTPHRLISAITPPNGTKISHLPIKFYGVELGHSINEVRLHLGRPNFTWKNEEYPTHKVFIYRLKISQIRCFAVIHFLHDTLFFITAIFKELSVNNAEKIYSTLQAKYLLEEPLQPDQCIRDEFGNTLKLDNHHYLVIKYVSGNPKFLDTLTSILQFEQQKKTEADKNLHRKLAQYL
ncbi:MAG: hypothetical protein ACFB15_18735 [Cyclobacteriaceae bacterium]